MPGPVPVHSCDQTLYLQPTASIKGRPLSPATATARLSRHPHLQVTSLSFTPHFLLFFLMLFPKSIKCFIQSKKNKRCLPLSDFLTSYIVQAHFLMLECKLQLQWNGFICSKWCYCEFLFLSLEDLSCFKSELMSFHL